MVAKVIKVTMVVMVNSCHCNHDEGGEVSRDNQGDHGDQDL
jgi:hypothetical protein